MLQGRYPAHLDGHRQGEGGAYKSPKDLKGMKIGVSAPGSSTNRLVLHMLAKDGLKGDDVSIIGVGTAAGAIAAIESGNIDAISNVDPVITMLESKGDIVVIADTRTAKGTAAVFGSPEMPRGCAVRADRLREKESEHRAGVDQRDGAGADLAAEGDTRPDRLDRAARVPAGQQGRVLASYAKVKDAFSPDGRFSKEGAENTLKYLAAFNPAVKPAAINLTQTFDNSYVEKALAKYKK